jgi:hypothetical protein
MMIATMAAAVVGERQNGAWSMFRSRGTAQFVMGRPRALRPGGVPATHVLLGGAKDVGARHKAGHDDGEIVLLSDRYQL